MEEFGFIIKRMRGSVSEIPHDKSIIYRELYHVYLTSFELPGNLFHIVYGITS